MEAHWHAVPSPAPFAARVLSSLKQDTHRAANKKAHPVWGGLFHWEPGGVLLSHGIPRTIIGAEAFHGPVRDGKAWDHLAMTARQSLKFFAFNK